MTDYVKSTNFASKDSLASGNPLKIVKGTEIDTELNNIATAVATKADLNSAILVTPNLGTPSAGVLTNATGLPLTTGVTGTLLVSNGGTGATSITANALVKGNGTNAFTAATAAEIVSAIGATAVTNATNATNATTAATVSTTVASGATGTTQSNADNSTKMATTAYVQNMGLGWGQTWQDVKSSRAGGTDYQNSTGKPIQVALTVYGGDYNSATAYVGTSTSGYVKVGYAYQVGAGVNCSISFIVPPGHYYKVTLSTAVIDTWAELR